MPYDGQPFLFDAVVSLTFPQLKVQLKSLPPPSESPCSAGDASSTSTQSSTTCIEPSKSTSKPLLSTCPVTVDTLPETLQNILSLHSCFLKALSIHYAHNAAGSPAPLGHLSETMTSLWKKHCVIQVDIQRMLALYEYSSEPVPVFDDERKVIHNMGPFKLIASGVGNAKAVTVEYVGEADSITGTRSFAFMPAPFDVRNLQMIFKLHLVELVIASRNASNTALSFITKGLSVFPLLACALGSQSAQRQQKALERRTEILRLSTAAQMRRSKLTKSPAHEATVSCQEDEPVAATVKYRTQSLFDRVAAKAALNASSFTPTAADILRRHAIGRIEEVVGILRMKQQQKSRPSSGFSPVQPKAVGKVSFSMSQLKRDIGDSVTIPISQDEVRVCLKILADEIQQSWVKIVESGVGERKTEFVVLEGDGMAGTEVKKVLEEGEMGTAR